MRQFYDEQQSSSIREGDGENAEEPFAEKSISSIQKLGSLDRDEYEEHFPYDKSIKSTRKAILYRKNKKVQQSLKPATSRKALPKPTASNNSGMSQFFMYYEQMPTVQYE